MKTLTIIVFWLLHTLCIAQHFCRYDQPKKFKELNPGINSEHAGLLPNAVNLEENQIQVEGCIYLLSFNRKYAENVPAGFLRFRYAPGSSVEIQTGVTIQSPIVKDTYGYSKKQYYLGIKHRIFILDGYTSSWHCAYSLKFIMQQSSRNETDLRGGYTFALNNTWKLRNVLQFDLSGGSRYFPAEDLFQKLVSGRILMKDDPSKIGIFIGFSVDEYNESLATLGMLFSDNCSFIFQLSVGFLDQGVSPNISYAHVFRKRK